MIFWKWENYGDHKKASGCHRRQEMNRQNAEDFYRSGNTLSHTVMTDECHYACMLSCFSCVLPSATPWTTACRLLCPRDSPGKNTERSCHALLQGIFPTQGLNSHLLHLPSPTLAGEFFMNSTTWEVHMSLSVQFSHSDESDSLQPHGLQHARPPCPSPTPRLDLMSSESVMSSNHLILCHPLLLPPSIFPSIRVFSNESVLPIRWPKYWSFSFSSSPSNEDSGLISIRMNWLYLLAVQGTLKGLLQHYSSKASILWRSVFFTVQLSHPYMTTGKTTALTRQTFVGKLMSLLFNMLPMPKPLTVWITINCGKF